MAAMSGSSPQGASVPAGQQLKVARAAWAQHDWPRCYDAALDAASDEPTAEAERGVELGRTLRCADLESEALQALGRVRIDEGRAADGLALLDEAMLFAIEGRLSPYSTGKVYCSLISACEQLSDHRRAAEWTAA